VKPQFYEVVWLLNSLRLGNKKTLEDIGEMTHVELVVEVKSSFTEVLLNFAVKSER